MKSLITLFLIFSSLILFSQNGKLSNSVVSPLASYSEKWNDIKYDACNTATGSNYMSKKEKEVIYILNLVRTNPALFAKTVLKKYPSISGKDYLADDVYYYQSLVNTLLSLTPQQLIYPDEKCWSSAKCHAYSSGLTGYIGHARQSKTCKIKKNYQGECCDYGNADPLDIVLSLLIDEGVPSLGHRYLLLNSYSKAGVSIQPHKKYGTNTVIDFYY
jgi:hypothetical protein